MTATSLVYYQEKLGKTQIRKMRFVYTITGAKTIAEAVKGYPVLTGFDAISAQSTIDNFLGTSSEFLLAAFDATSMGTDAVYFIIDMKGQAKAAPRFRLTAVQGTYGGTFTFASSMAPVTALTASTLEGAIAVGTSGNIAVKAVISSLDGLTTGQLVLDVDWIAK